MPGISGVAKLADGSLALVLDDSSSVRNTIDALQRDENYKVTLARDGRDAVRAMMDNRFSVILTDLEMPQLNGFELPEFIRNRSDQPQVPVIMLTSRGQDKHREHALSAGANAFLIKLYSDQNLLETVRAAIWGESTESKAEMLTRRRAIDIAINLN